MSNLLSILIVEDESPAQRLLTKFIMAHPRLSLADIADNGQKALQKLKEHRFDLVLLDINLPVMSGLEVVENLETLPYIIFTTAYDRHAIKAFEIGAVDYLLKPYSEKRFHHAIEKVLKAIDAKKSFNFNKDVKKFGLSFKAEEKYYLMPHKDIIYISSHKKHVIIHTTEKDYESLLLLKDLEQKIPQEIFCRMHKQFIVNLYYISHIQYFVGGRYTVFLKDDEETSLPIGRKYLPPLKMKLGIDG